MKSKYFLIAVSFLLGVFSVFLYETDFSSGEISPIFQVRKKSNYSFINPLIDFETVDRTKRGDLVALEKTVHNFIDEKMEDSDSDISQASFYLKELNTGAWIGVDEREKFAPASLLKIPLAMAYFKIAEHDPSYLNKKIKYVTAASGAYYGAKQNIAPENKLIEGEEYTLDDLVKRVILYSDNQAQYLLFQNIQGDEVDSIYSDLGISLPKQGESEDFISVRDYASFFRILYNASYLDKDMSEKLLELLSNASYDDGLAAGLPKEIKIANKFGERGVFGSNMMQFHDCGIVYYPAKPYLICVMTRGKDLYNQQAAVRQISKIVFDAINK